MGQNRIFTEIMSNNNTYKIGAPLNFDFHLKRGLRGRLGCLEEVKNQRWYKNDSYVRFQIFDESYKIIVDKSYHPREENLQTIHNGKWTTYGQIPVYYFYGYWVINATDWFDTLDEIVYTCLQINDWLADYDSQEEMEKLAAIVDAENVDYRKIGYEFIKEKENSYSLWHSLKLEELIDSFACRFITHLNLEEDRFGALYQVMSLLATVIRDCYIEEKERQKCGILQQ